MGKGSSAMLEKAMQGIDNGLRGDRGSVGVADLAIQVQALKTRMDTVLPTLATREQLAQEVGALRSEMKHEIGALRSEMKEELGELRSEMKQEIGDLRSEMKQEIGDLRSEMKHELGGLRSELKQEVGGLRAEIKDSIGGLRAEMHQTVTSAIKWGLGIGLSAITAAAAFVTLMSPHFPPSSRAREAVSAVMVKPEALPAQP
ncbi:hypothetical protein CS062_01865 [Roseateles chitinivorans]|uniref:DUF1640 domain-containing protein n=2 Tax=Roseateles chitinivorans TaxID=2917965 RepID=A0A2G9CEV3_9BURK|nr:hypothetical protein CS062_01865 [Roseateles chitinivorans]